MNMSLFCIVLFCILTVNGMYVHLKKFIINKIKMLMGNVSW